MKTMALISCVFPPEPVVSAQISNNLAHYLSADNKVTVVCPRPTRPNGAIYETANDERTPFDKITVKSYVYPGASFLGRMIESISFGWASKNFIEEHNKEISVIYANTWPLFAQLSVARASHKYNIPLVLHIQDIYPETLTDKLGLAGVLIKKLLLPIDKYVLRNSTTVVAIGHKMAEFLSTTRGISMNNIEVVYNWQDEARFNENMNKSQRNEKFTLMYLGSLSPSANIEGVIDAFGKSESKNSKLIIAGNGNSKNSCLNSASRYPHLDIEFTDAPYEKTPDLLYAADVLILSLMKGAGKYSIPSKLAGYMHSGKPILAYIDTDSNASDIITSAGCGWAIPAGDETALVNKMRELTEVPDESLSKIGSAGKSYALQHLSKKANLEKLVQIIKNAIN